MFALGMVQKLPCYDGAWFFGASSQYTHACYSDIPHLYQGRGFADGLVPYFDKIPGDMEYLEYPVLTGVFMEVAAWLTPGSGTIQKQEQWYWMVNAGMLMACAAVIAVCCARIHHRRPWDGLLVALAPAFALTATINWDLLAVALTGRRDADVVARAASRLRCADRPRHSRQVLPVPGARDRSSCCAGGRASGARS